MSRPAGKTWTLKITVAQYWIDDGFKMTDDRCRAIADKLLPYAEWDEITVKVAPSVARKRSR